MFKKLSEKPIAEVQNAQVEKWKEEDLLHKCVTARADAKPFVFYEGPPTANGKPGIHHVMARTLKDSICRYKTMQGFQVNRKAGWEDVYKRQVIIIPSKLSCFISSNVL